MLLLRFVNVKPFMYNYPFEFKKLIISVRYLIVQIFSSNKSNVNPYIGTYLKITVIALGRRSRVRCRSNFWYIPYSYSY